MREVVKQQTSQTRWALWPRFLQQFYSSELEIAEETEVVFSAPIKDYPRRVWLIYISKEVEFVIKTFTK